MKEVVVRELWTYPVKSCQGVAVDSIEIASMGIVGDRRFAIWADGDLVEQKLHPNVASIGATFDPGTEILTLTHVEHGIFEHRLRADGDLRPTTWVLDEFQTIDQGDEVADWISTTLSKNVRLVAPDEAWRINFPIPQMALLHDRPKRSFTSASPVGLANQASLDELNTLVNTPVPMDRFRMNVMVDGLDAYEEDRIHSLHNDEVELLQVSPAERCAIITTDQRTGERPENNLMATLSKHRSKPKHDRFGSGLIFGNYMTVGREGTLRIGDRLTMS
jgi:uncharacterized protein YcbX